VLFADIVGFTQLSASADPHDVLTLLNRLFSRFDELAERHGLEKIKTIGDAYMVVGGLPVPRDDHAEAVAEMALDMIREIESPADAAPPLQLRIGIDTGPVIAGVIGIRRFIYDVWGDTVNTASRMESHGLPGKIQVTERTYAALSDRYAFVERGVIDVKGRGPMRTWLLEGPLTDEQPR
jgi:adenylate cyclase